ncbi:MAG: hypothetical protein WHT47_05040, partial [Hydrogenothermaceae bacterium]
RVIKQYSENQRYVETKVEDLESQKVDLNQLKEEKSKFEKELSSVEESIKILENSIKEKKNSFQSISDKLKELEIARIEKLSKEKLVAKLEADIKTLSEKLEEINQIEVNFEEIEKKYKNFTALKEKLNLVSDIEKLQIQKNSLEEKIKNLKEDTDFIDRFKDIAETFKQNEKNYENISNQIETLSKKQGEIDQIKSTIDQLSEDLKQLKQKMMSIAENLTQNYNKKFQMLRHNPHMVDEHINQSVIKSRELQKEKEDLLNRISAIETEGKLEREKIQKISALEGVCPTCNRPIEQHEKESLLKDVEKFVEKKREEWKALKDSQKKIEDELKKQEEIREKLQEFKQLFEIYKEKNSQLSKLKGSLTALSHAVSKVDELKKQKDEIEKFIKENRADYGRYETLIKQNVKKQLEDNIKNLEDIKQELNIKLSQLDITLDKVSSFKEDIKSQIERDSEIEGLYFKHQGKIKEKSSLMNDIENKKRELEDVKLEIKSLCEKVSAVNEEELSTLKEKLDKEIESLEVDKIKLLEYRSEINTKLKYIDEDIEKVERINREIEDLKNKLWQYEKVINALTKVNKLIKDNALYSLPKITEDIFSRFGFSHFSGLKFADDYSILLSINEVGISEPTEVDALSGGQRIALALALRFAISKLLNYKSDFLILDEPGIFMDKYRRRELIDILGDLKEQNFVKQLIIVTHDEEVEDRADTIYKVDMGEVKQV